MYQYIKDPEAIETESFRQIRALTALDRFSDDEAQIAMRLVHTCGDPAIADHLRFCGAATDSALQAIQQQAPVLCDVEMVKQGLTKRLQTQPAHCFLNDPQTPALAAANGETRCMAAVQLWQPLLKDAVVIIGNAPTALFRLLELLNAGAPKPALIIGMPVGFVGAAESKQALWEAAAQQHLNAVLLEGRAGGSALAASTWNAFLRMANGIRF